MLTVVVIPARHDNYIFLLHDSIRGKTAVVDPADAEPVLAALKTRNWTLDLILNTHHHHDHTHGNLALKRATGCKIIAAAKDQHRIPGVDQSVGEGDAIEVGTSYANVLEVPGHTTGHIAYHFADDAMLFCGDTIFVMGCGRLFEGTPKMMWASLSKLRALPDHTRIYCAHEYTLANAKFAADLEPNNDAVRQRLTHIAAVRATGHGTIPGILGQEKATNPFLRVEDISLRHALGPAFLGASDVDVFAEIRRRRNQHEL